MAEGKVGLQTTPHLNLFGLEIRWITGKGRGIFATRSIPAMAVIEISPVLFFEKEEYIQHGRHTILDHYTFVWGDGRMALPLGLGSLFNHSSSPNVTYTKRKETACIEYKTVREVMPEEELCIFYGHNLWFEDISHTSDNISIQPDGSKEEGEISAWLELGNIDV